MMRREVLAAWLAERDAHVASPAMIDSYLREADQLLVVLDGLEMWTLNDVAAWSHLRTGTISSYRAREQMPSPDLTYGRTHLWEPDVIRRWRPRG